MCSSDLAIGQITADNSAVAAAEMAARMALSGFIRETEPIEWGRAQRNLGALLAVLGENEVETDFLGEAVLAYRAALDVFEEHVEPGNWAMTQSNLAHALRLLGERWDDDSLLRDAAEAASAALRVYGTGNDQAMADRKSTRLNSSHT